MVTGWLLPEAPAPMIVGWVAGMEYSALIRDICELGLSRKVEVAEPAGWALAQRLSGVIIDEQKYPLELFAGGGT